ncbi:MAG: thioether cross-link-forming SCIFF peptide maturase [Clostridia bacterium]|nr:thioether cross-link-forming SCIFF peptide maturase [Clostridia bacterium]
METIRTDWNRDIHKFKFEELHILLDINSGSVHIIDEATWDLLEALEKLDGNISLAIRELHHRYPREELWAIVSQLKSLSEQELLFTSDSWAWRRADKFSDDRVKSLCLHVSHDCNMRCGYCFAGDGSFGGDKSLMSGDVGEAAIDFLLENSRRKHLEVDFFGGEPLLNFDVVEHLTEYGIREAEEKGKIIRFTLTTNCLLLDERVMDYLDKYSMQVILSLDGRRETNDRVRMVGMGKSSYDIIVPKILDLTQSRGYDNYYVRGTYTRKNMDFSDDVFHLMDLGLEHISLEPVVAPPEEFGFTREDIPKLEKEYEILTLGLLERLKGGEEVDFFHFNIDFSGGPCIPRIVRGCSAGVGYFAVDPSGDLYPCHQFVGDKNYWMGDVFSGLQKHKLQEEFQQAHIYNKPLCKGCWARFYCSGGCHANASAYMGSLDEPYDIACSLQKKRIECGIYYQLKKDFL